MQDFPFILADFHSIVNHFSSLSRSYWILSLSSMVSATPPNSASSKNVLTMHVIPLYKSLKLKQYASPLENTENNEDLIPVPTEGCFAMDFNENKIRQQNKAKNRRHDECSRSKNTHWTAFLGNMLSTHLLLKVSALIAEKGVRGRLFCFYKS